MVAFPASHIRFLGIYDMLKWSFTSKIDVWLVSVYRQIVFFPTGMVLKRTHVGSRIGSTSNVKQLTGFLRLLEKASNGSKRAETLFSIEHLGGAFIFFEFWLRKLGAMIQFEEHIFQMGWLNHQLEMLWKDTPQKLTWPAEDMYISMKKVLLQQSPCLAF